MAFHQAQTLSSYALAGAGAIAGATSVILKSFESIDGVPLVMADFGLIGYATLEPGNSAQEEQISFTGITQNANGTATLTGVKNVLFLSPYTETSGLAKTHPGSSACVISNTAGFYSQFPIKQNDETITGQWTFSVFPITPSNSDASTTVKGVTKLSVAPASATDPIAVGTNDSRVPVAYAVDSVGTDAYAITPTPALTAYSNGQIVVFKVGTANTGAATLAISGLAAKTIKKNASSDLATGDFVVGQIVEVAYDGTNFQLLSPTSAATTVVTGVVYNSGSDSKNLADAGAATTVIAHGLGVAPSYVRLKASFGSATRLGTTDGTFANSKYTCYGVLYSQDFSVNVNNNSTSYVIWLGTTASAFQTATVAVDATNITLTWTKTSTPTGTLTFLWEAQGTTTTSIV